MKVLIGTPCYDNVVHLCYMQTIIETMSILVESNIQNEWYVTGGSLVEMARNRIAAKVINDPSFTHLLFIDSDMGFTPESFANLMMHADLPVIGMVSPYRRFPIEYNTLGMGEEVRPGVHVCKAIGTGISLIRREVLEKIAEKSPSYADGGRLTYQIFNTGVKAGRFRGEDYNFCEKWTEIGGKIYALTDCEVVHRGNHEFKYEQDLLQAKG